MTIFSGLKQTENAFLEDQCSCYQEHDWWHLSYKRQEDDQCCNKIKYRAEINPPN